MILAPYTFAGALIKKGSGSLSRFLGKLWVPTPASIKILSLLKRTITNMQYNYMLHIRENPHFLYQGKP